MILGISGKKESGKNTVANIIHGIILKKKQMIQNWKIGNRGELSVQLMDGSWGEFDIARKDQDFINYADHNMWPYVKLYAFADIAKFICMDLFHIPYECLWGTDSQKNTIQPHLLWENMPGVVTVKTYENKGAIEEGHLIFHAPGPMTSREFMQYFASDIMRKMYAPIWVTACLKKINNEKSELAIISDVRFLDEAEAINKQNNSLLLRLDRAIHKDKHKSEISLDDYPFKHIISNKNCSIDELCEKINTFYETEIKVS